MFVFFNPILKEKNIDLVDIFLYNKSPQIIDLTILNHHFNSRIKHAYFFNKGV